jgi:RNA polymerase sigma-70 factor (ECF subfamily)
VLFLFSLRLRLSGGRDDRQHEGEPDAALIERARGGNLSAFNQLVERHERAVFNVALRYMRSREQAEDVTQETFLRAWRSLDTFRNDAGEGFRAWLLRIASNRALDLLRASSRRPADSLDSRLDNDESAWEPEGTEETPIDFAVRGDLGARLEHLLGRIHPDQRLVVILSDIHGHAYDEIAEIAGVPIGTVKSRINRGRARLRDLLLADDAGRELLGVHARLESGDGVG